MPSKRKIQSLPKPKSSISQSERVAILHYLNTHPNAKKLLDAIVDPSNQEKELAQVIAPSITNELQKARMIGINIGWQSAFIRAYENSKKLTTLDEVMAYLKEESEKARAVTAVKENYEGIDMALVQEVYDNAVKEAQAPVDTEEEDTVGEVIPLF